MFEGEIGGTESRRVGSSGWFGRVSLELGGGVELGGGAHLGGAAGLGGASGLGVAVLGAILLSVLGCAPGSEPPSESQALAEIEPAPGDVEAISLLGASLVRPAPSGERRVELEANLAAAEAKYAANPEKEENAIWLGRRLSYVGRYRDAITAYTRGLELYPDSYKLLRHRGHRFITLRRFEDAVADLARAADLAKGQQDEIEPDGIPNSIGVPLSTTQFNIWYHLGLAHYLKAEYEQALDAYRKCLEVSTNPDLLVATSDWMYMTLRRLGRDQEAAELLRPIEADMEIVENDAYHRRLLMYKGLVDPDELLDLRTVEDPAVDDSGFDDSERALQIATQGYGVANWYLAEGDTERATEILERIVDGASWAAFGYIAAEADLARMQALKARSL